MARFTDKSIIVTGAGSGIGRATAMLFAREGGKVVVADKTDGADATAKLITDAGGTAVAIQMDAGLEEDVIRTVQLAVDSFGGLDIIFANAGISGGMANIFDTDVALITEVLRVNLIGPYLAIKHAAPKIAERGGGAIVLTASVAGIRSGAGSPAYSASKAGVINLAKTSAQQLAGIERARQRDLPRADRNRHDQADLRLCARSGQDGPRRPAQPAAPRRAARGTGRGRRVPRVATPRATSTARRSRSMAGCRRATR